MISVKGINNYMRGFGNELGGGGMGGLSRGVKTTRAQ
jgi:hypothetical protein